MCVLVSQESYDIPAKKPFVTTEWFPACFNDVCISCWTVTDWFGYLDPVATVAVSIYGLVLDIVSSGSLLARQHFTHAAAWCGHVCHICSWLCCEYNCYCVQFFQQMFWQHDGLTMDEIKLLRGWSVCQTAQLKSGILYFLKYLPVQKNYA